MEDILLIIILVIILFFLYKNYKNTIPVYPLTNNIHTNNINKLNDGRINIWTYSPEESNKYRNNLRYPYNKYEYIPSYINLTIKSLLNNMDNICNIHIINKDNIYNYLPDFPVNLNNDNRFKEKQIMDLLGAYLLYTYGGLWISPGTVCLKRNYNHLISDINNHDIVTFGSSNAYSCDNSMPNNYIIGSKLNNPVIKQYIKRLTELMLGKIDTLHKHVSHDFNPLGESIELFNINQKHYDCSTDGTYNIHNRKLNMEDYLGSTPIEYSNNLMFIAFPYEQLDIETDYRWFKFSKVDELINSNINIISYL